MRRLVNPLVGFIGAGLLLFLAIWWTTNALSERAARTEAIFDAKRTTDLLAHSVAEPAVPRGLERCDPGAVDRFDRRARDRLLVGEVRRIKIWRRDGTIVYSDETRLIGKRFDLGDDEEEVLDHGGTLGEISDLSKPENQFEVAPGGLLETYTRIRSPEGTPLLFEAYYSENTVEQRAADVLTPFRRITVGGLAAILLLGVPLIGGLTLRLTRAARARERLMRRAVESSEQERRRIARDLHDGVVQELAGTAFALSGSSREPEVPERVRTELVTAGGALRRSLRSLRSLLVELHPPGLDASNLAAALEDLTAPAASAGIEARVTVHGLEGAPDHVVTLVWRTAQEAIRNAVRHAEAQRLTVDVEGDARRVRLVVSDDGVGFDTAAPAAATSYGLRGLQSLVEDGGGSVVVESAPGAGTTLKMTVER